MHRSTQLTLAALFLGVLWLVGLQVLWPFSLLGGRLKGAVAETPAPAWDFASLRSGEALRAASTWYDAHVGLRNFWVRLDNEVTYVLFREATEHKTGTNLVVGKHDWLFERQYVKHAVTPGRPEDARVREAIRHMRSVQDKLARRGIPFLLLVAPSKVEVYSEHVPAAAFGGRLPGQITTNYERYRSEFNAAGINFYDGPRIFLEWKQAGQRNLFARAGSHWSYVSALQVLRDVRDRLNPQMRHLLPPLVLEKQLSLPARLIDADLLNLLNLLFDFPFNHDQPFPVLVRQKDVPSGQLPRILWVHDSFGWPLIELLYNANALQPAESLYYFQNFYRIPEGTRTSADLHRLDWEAFLQKHDAVVMVWTEIAFEGLGWGFFETLDAQLK